MIAFRTLFFILFIFLTACAAPAPTMVRYDATGTGNARLIYRTDEGNTTAEVTLPWTQEIEIAQGGLAALRIYGTSGMVFCSIKQEVAGVFEEVQSAESNGVNPDTECVVAIQRK